MSAATFIPTASGGLPPAPAVPAPAPVPEAAPNVAPAPGPALRQAASVLHQGTVIAFARDAEGTAVYYNVLDLQVGSASDTQQWTGFSKLAYPSELRSAGLGIVTVADPKGSILHAVDTPLKAVSDGSYVCLFQQSSRGTLLLNRFMLKRVAAPGGGATMPVLEPIWEVRFQRSGKPDTPDGPRDTQSYLSPDGAPFIEPTIELPMVRDLAGGWFDALILPVETSTVRSWQLFAVNAKTRALDLFSCPMDDAGLFDLRDKTLDANGVVEPDASITLTLEPDAAQAPLPLQLAGAPSATLYMLHERVRSTSGDALLLKRVARVMVSQPVVRDAQTKLEVATLDFALSKDGRLARIDGETAAAPIAPADYALEFAEAAHLTLPDNGSLALKGGFKAEFWIQLTSAPLEDRYVFGGDPMVAADKAAPFVKITRELELEVGFGDGSAAVSARTTGAVLSPSVWAHVQVAFDPAAASGNFSVLVNDSAVPLTGADAKSKPAGAPLTRISGQRDGFVGILDFLRIWDASSGTAVLVGDWELDTVDYDHTPPITPDSSPSKNDAVVDGAVLVPSTAPVELDADGRLHIDPDGLTVYAGVLDFAEPAASPGLLTGSDGYVHMYYEGVAEAGRDGLFTVVQFDAESSRATYDLPWTSVVGQGTESGALELVAARSGTFMNQSAIAVKPAAVGDLCNVSIDDRHGRSELWRGVPRALGRFSDALNGAATGDASDPAVRAGTKTFYDEAGRYAMSRLTVTGADARLTLMSRYPELVQLTSAAIGDVNDATCTLTLTLNAPAWTGAGTITQAWKGLPVYADSAVEVLGGTSSSYDYRPEDSASVAAYALAAFDAGGRSDQLLVLTRADVSDLTLGIAPVAGSPDRCAVAVALKAGGTPKTFDLPDVARVEDAFAAALDAVCGEFLAVAADGTGGMLRDREPAPLPRADMRAWSTLLLAFPDQPLVPVATLAAQGPVDAAVLQSARLKAGDVEQPLTGASTMFRCAPSARPANGGVALVQDTTGLTDGTASLVVTAVNGGWVRRSPDAAIALDGADAILIEQAAPTADVLALAGDMTVETWCRPASFAADDDRSHLITYHRLGSVDLPDERIRYALGLKPAPALRFGGNTQIKGSYNLRGDRPECSMQIWAKSSGIGAGQLLRFATIGVSQPFVTLAVDGTGHAVATYAGGAKPVTSKSTLVVGAFTQLTVTLAAEGADQVRLSLYVDGVLEADGTEKAVVFANPPGAFSAGSTGAGFAMQANGALLWRRALAPDEVALTYRTTVTPDDPGLVVAWYLTDGSGNTVTNQALEGLPFTSEILNQPSDPWPKRGVYALPWAANRDYGLLAPTAPLLGGWRHLAAAYRSAYALHLDGASYADCGNDPSLDLASAFSIEAWLTPDRTDAVQTLVSKPGNYQVQLGYDNAILLSVWTSVGRIDVKSTVKVEAGKAYSVAATVDTGPVKPLDAEQAAAPTYYLRARLYVNGVVAGEFFNDKYADSVSIATSKSRLNLGRSPEGAAYLTGSLSDVRLWSRALTEATVADVYRTHRNESTDGLVSYWRFAESRGKVAYDAHDLNNALLSSNALWSIYAPASALTLMIDGEPQADVEVIDPAAYGGYGVEQLTVAANRGAGGAIANGYRGELNDLRIWSGERTAEQIREDMYRELTGSETGLAGYWTFNAGSGLTAADATGHGNDGTLSPVADPPRWVVSRAPLSNEAKEVYNALGGLHTDFVQRIAGTPSVVDYADTRRDAYGALYSVMKRCYAATAYGTADLVTGFTLGDLDTVYAGQVQTSPSLIGFVEGAPPMPSENQTNPYWSEVTGREGYAGNATVKLNQAQSTTRAFSGSEKTGSSTSLAGKVGLYFDTNAGLELGTLIAGASWQTFTSDAHLGAVLESKQGTDAQQDIGFAYGGGVTLSDELSTGGEWEPAGSVLNAEVGRRYVPANTGYALVKSLTADLYLAKLRGANTVVKMTLVPNTDIPEDVNIIDFPIDPGYTKNGTLDGMVGFKPDPSFPFAEVARGSYFRPAEAYSLKRAIERQDKQLEAYYQQFDTANHTQGQSIAIAGGAPVVTSGFTRFRDEVLPAEPAYDWKAQLAKRSLVNTYVWTASGGLHTEQSQLVDSYTETYTGVGSWESGTGLHFDLSAAAFVGVSGEFDVLFGNTVEIASVKNAQSSSAFGVEVDFAPDRYLKRPLVDSDGAPTGFTEQDAPGKVDGYRFMSFFVAPSQENFDRFGQVVDQNWLRNSPAPDAAALRTATDQANGAWRILHRVTYVSRVPPQLQPTPSETVSTQIAPPANLESNTVIVRMIERLVTAPAPTPADIGRAVGEVLGTSPASPGKLAGVLPWWPDFLTASEDKRGEAYRELSDLRTDLLQYMVAKYAADQAAAGAGLVAALRSRQQSPEA